ncbi:MAG: NAD(+) synthase, partial [Eubacteriales bacterium]|nr:NAD(+) synthase [Eubacteriales bacterium]
MPGFGTTSRTKNNSRALVEALGCKYREISVAAACREHFANIGHDEANHNSVYENAQARERTKILLSIANEEGLLDVGTGDLSEAALGWTTFGGDHLAQYGVNASVPKTIIRRVVAAVGADFGADADAILRDILATPVSPELLPANGGEISQKTEELVGSYELHDLFLYYFLKGKGPKELYDIALGTLDFGEEEVYRTLGTFLRRFFSQQFKRNCAPEAPLVCLSIAPSVWNMPSDMASEAFMAEYERIKRRQS